MQDILDRLRAAYRSLDEPEFFFVGSAIANNPYAGLVQELGRSVHLEEDTDPNDDVSFGYVLSSGGATWVLRLSMVGPYAALLRINETGAVELVGPSAEHQGTVERQVLALLARDGVRLLDRDSLEQRVPLRLDDADEEDVTLYQALFTATDILPWHA